jgi:hypothetical protein
MEKRIATCHAWIPVVQPKQEHKMTITSKTIFAASLSACVVFLSASTHAYADRKPRPSFPDCVSKAETKTDCEADAQRAEAALKKAANSLKRNEEFLQLAAARDADGVRQMLVKAANVDAPFSVTFAKGVGGPADRIKITWECDGPGFLKGCHLHFDPA